MTSYRRAFASRNCVISGANLCELVRTRRESVANLRKPVANPCELGANPSRIRRESARTRRELARTCANPRMRRESANASQTCANLRELARICRECFENFRESVANPRNLSRELSRMRRESVRPHVKLLRICVECASVRCHVTRLLPRVEYPGVLRLACVLAHIAQ